MTPLRCLSAVLVDEKDSFHNSTSPLAYPTANKENILELSEEVAVVEEGIHLTPLVSGPFDAKISPVPVEVSIAKRMGCLNTVVAETTPINHTTAYFLGPAIMLQGHIVIDIFIFIN
jgi:hypothetical protein